MRRPPTIVPHAYRGELRAAVRRQWRAEELRRRLGDPAPIPVRWRLVPAALAVQDHDINVFGGHGPVTASGTVEELAGFLRGLPSSRLVVLGDPGAGKTTAAIRLVLDLTADLRGDPDDDPIPVLLSVGSWQPRRHDLRTWLRGVLCTDYPGLAAVASDGRTVAETLIEDGAIMPVLDGLDEMPPDAHADAVATVNASLHRGDPLIVTCRTAEYQAAVTRSDIITGAAVVELRPLTPSVLASYLPRTAPPRADSTTTWDALLTEITRQPREAAAERVLAVFRTPFMASLAREAYSETGADPTELLDPRRFAHAADIEAYLLDQAVPAGYRGSRIATRAGAWLTALAGRMDHAGTYDLAWWRLFQQGTSRLGVAVGAAVGGTAVGILSVGIVRDVWLSAIASLAGAALGAYVGQRQPAVPSTAQWSMSGGFRRVWQATVTAGRPVRAGAMAWLVALLVVASLVGVRSGWTAAIVAAAAVGATRALDAWLDVPLDMTTPSAPMTLLGADRAAGLSRAALRALILGGTAWFLAGPAAGGAVGAAAFVASVGFTAWFRFTLARLSQAVVGRLPWRLPAFLVDATRRGVLRQAGGVYQFRHARLQDRLAGRPPPVGDIEMMFDEEEPVPATTVARASRPAAVILTALEVEYGAVRAHLTDITPVVHRTGTLFEVGWLPGGHRRIALTVLGEGNQTAAVIAERAATLFQPDLLVFAGVAGALHDDLALGDVVVGTRVYAYQSGQEAPEGFLARPRAWEAPHRLEQRARYLNRLGHWHALLADPGAAPKVHFRPIAAGEVVVTAQESRQASILRSHYDDAAAIEMEGAGLARAAHLHDALPALVVRGISDHADHTKRSLDKAGWQQIAAANAAAFALSLVADLPPDE